MPPDAGCLKFLEELTGPGPCSAELESHLGTCSECAQRAKVLKGFRALPRPAPPTPSIHLKNQIVTRLEKEFPPLPTAPDRPPLATGGYPLVTGGLAAALVAAAMLWFSRGTPIPPVPAPTGTTARVVTITEVGTSPRALRQGERVIITGPDTALDFPGGHRVVFGRPGSCIPTLEGLRIQMGKVAVSLSDKPFAVTVPGGRLAGGPCQATVEVVERGSRLRVDQGMVHWVSDTGPAQDFSADGKEHVLWDQEKVDSDASQTLEIPGTTASPFQE